MQTNVKQLLCLLLGVALAFLVPFQEPEKPERRRKRGAASAAAPRVGGVWSDPKFLKQHLANAIAILPVATGMQFTKEPAVAVGSREQVAGALRADFDASFRKMGAKNDAEVVALAQAFAERLPAVFDPASNTILVLPENAVAAAARIGDESVLEQGVLRLLLVRMCAIALDRQLFPEWKEALDKAESVDAVNAAGAMLQGHAQYITERVATAATAPEWQLQPYFVKLVTLLTAPGPENPKKAALDAEIKFSILKGHAFMSLLAKKKGRTGVLKHLKEPPTSRTPLFDPEAYLGAGKKDEPAAAGDLAGRVVQEFAGLHAGEGWTEATRPLAQADADALLAGIEPQYTASIRAAFASGTEWVFTKADGDLSTTVTLIEMQHPGMAEALVNSAKSGSEAKKTGNEITEGAGRDGGLPGYVVSGDGRTTQWTYEGKYVLGLSTNDADADRDTQDDVLEAAAETLAKAQKSRSNRRKRR